MSVSRLARKYKVNDNFFKMWSPDMAYILGFWWADGNICGNEFSISQHKKDEYLLKKIASVVGSNYKFIYPSRGNNVKFWVTSREIIKDIKALGGTENKSLVVGFPNVPEEYLSDFIRGYFDGDGCISYCKNKSSFVSMFTTGSEKMARGVFAVLKKSIADLSGSFSIRRRFTKEVLGHPCNKLCVDYRISFSHNDTIRLGKFLYRSFPELKLERKYVLFKKAGEIKCLKRNFLPFKDARNIVHEFGIKSKTEWRFFCSSKKRSVNIPSLPNRTYVNKGWISWKDWLGYNKVIEKRKESVPVFMFKDEGVLECFDSLKSAGRWVVEHHITDSIRPSSPISQCCQGKRPTAYGYRWIKSEKSS